MTEWWRVTEEDNPLGLTPVMIKRVNGFMADYYGEKIPYPRAIKTKKTRGFYRLKFRGELRKIKEGRKCFGSPGVHVFCKDTCAIRVQCHSRREAWLRLLARERVDVSSSPIERRVSK